MQSGAVGKGHYWRDGRPTAVTLVLLYLRERGITFLSPMEVRSWVQERFGLELDRRRLWDAFKKLERMGILKKIKRGWYKVVDLGRALAELARRLTTSSIATKSDCYRVATDARLLGSCAGRRRGSGLVWGDDGCVVVFRDHRRVRNVDDPIGLVEAGLVGAGVKWRLYQLFERVYAELLRRHGYSWYRIRRLRAKARRLAERIIREALVLVGGHACMEYDKRRRRCERGRFYPWEEFVRLALGEEGLRSKFQEFGVDVVFCLSDSFEVEELEELIKELREAVGSSRVYIPMNGAGSRR